MSGSSWHQMLDFYPGEALPGLYFSCLHFLLVPRVFCLQFCLQQVKCSSTGLKSSDSLGHCWTFLTPQKKKKAWVVSGVLFRPLSNCIAKHSPTSSESFCWTWAGNIALYTSGFILLLFPAIAFIHKQKETHTYTIAWGGTSLITASPLSISSPVLFSSHHTDIITSWSLSPLSAGCCRTVRLFCTGTVEQL